MRINNRQDHSVLVSWIWGCMAILSILLIPSYLAAQEWTPRPEQVLEKKADYSPYVTQRFPRQVFFGDTHHHSSYSFDSGMFGNTLGPEESFRFARGKAVAFRRSGSGPWISSQSQIMLPTWVLQI